ncbi:YhhA family cyclophane-containing RiPP [Sphingomonas sp.]|uniref:YhhA family cyclophane-containing RiPP n=1 Tax=Sphingomonas sp. TaxID=28214 RepID=UPI0039C948AA
MQPQNPATLRSAVDKSASVDSATLARLIEEVRNEPAGVERSYDRAHNRHNR